MKTKIAALALVLFATASTAALAQERGHRERVDREPGNASVTRETQRAQPDFQRSEPREFQRDTPRERPAPAPEARPAPATAPGEGPAARGGWRNGGEGGRPQTATGGERQGRDGWRNGGEGRRPEVPATAERQGRDGLADGGQWSRNRNPQTPSTDPSTERSHRPDGGRGDRTGGWDRNGRDNNNNRGRDGQWDGHNGRGDNNNRDRDGRWDGRNGRGDNDRDGRWDGNRRDGAHRWDRGQFRAPYQAQRRYRGSFWRPPVGFYAYSWSFGDLLPRGWYGNEYRILSWWSYGLPAPPPGCYWVRVGYDAILVDDFDGQVLEVVRMLFY